MTTEQKGNSAANGSGSKFVAEISFAQDGVLTDAAPAKEFGPYSIRGINAIEIDLTVNKGCDIKFVPMSNLDDDGVPQREGKDSLIGQIANGGGSDVFEYSPLRAPFIKIVLTKTEAGDMDVYYGELSGGL